MLYYIIGKPHQINICFYFLTCCLLALCYYCVGYYVNKAILPNISVNNFLIFAICPSPRKFTSL